MELTVIGISGAIAVVVAGLEGARQLHQGRPWVAIRDLFLVPWTVGWSLAGTVLLALGIGWLGGDLSLALLILLGGLWGILSWVSSPLGRAAQGIAVISACVWTNFLPIEAPILQLLAALGLGLGLIGVPLWGVLPSRMGSALLTALAQGWVLIAASTWGIRLADLMQGETGWYRALPCGLAALALVGGTVPLLVADPEESIESPSAIRSDPAELGTAQGRDPELNRSGQSSRSLWIGQIIGGIVASGLGGILVRNWLHQSLFYPIAFGIGVMLSLILKGLEGRLSRDAGGDLDPTQRLQQGLLSLALVGGAALLTLRLGGSYGAAVVGLGVLTFPSRWGATAALFLGARPLVQSLLYEFDLNLSGINITHAYTYAALFLGIAGVGIAAVMAWIYRGRGSVGLAVGLTWGSVLLTGLTGYFIHLRPQMAMVLGALMTALVIAALQPAVIGGAAARPSEAAPDPPVELGAQGLVLVLMAILTAVVTRDLTLMGATATRIERLWVLAGTLGIGVVILGVGTGVCRRWGQSSGDPHGRI